MRKVVCSPTKVGGNGASYLMAPFTHVSTDRPSRFTDGTYGVLYAGDAFETALFETIHHHARFMARTVEAPGWTSQFREIILSVRSPIILNTGCTRCSSGRSLAPNATAKSPGS